MVYLGERTDLDQPVKLYALSIAKPPSVGWLNSIGIQLMVLITALATGAGFYGKTLGYQQFGPLANFGWFAVILSVVFHTFVIIGNSATVHQIKKRLEEDAAKAGVNVEDFSLLRPIIAQNLNPGSRPIGIKLFAKVMILLRVVNIAGLASLGYTALPLLGLVAYVFAWSSNRVVNDYVVLGVRKLAEQYRAEINAPAA